MDKRVILLIVGPGKETYNATDIKEFSDALSLNPTSQVYIVGDGKKQVGLEEIEDAFKKICGANKMTIIPFCHGDLDSNKKFEFLLSDQSVSTQELFSLISKYRDDKPTDIFTPTCHGAGMLEYKDNLPRGSMLVALSAGDRVKLSEDIFLLKNYLPKMTKDASSYNLLEFFLLATLENRSYPFIGIAKEDLILNMNNLLKPGNYGHIELDNEQCDYIKTIGNQIEYLKTLKELNNLEKKYEISMDHYGMALGIVLNDLFKKELRPSYNHGLNADDGDIYDIDALVRKMQEEEQERGKKL